MTIATSCVVGAPISCAAVVIKSPHAGAPAVIDRLLRLYLDVQNGVSAAEGRLDVVGFLTAREEKP